MLMKQRTLIIKFQHPKGSSKWIPYVHLRPPHINLEDELIFEEQFDTKELAEKCVLNYCKRNGYEIDKIIRR